MWRQLWAWCVTRPVCYSCSGVITIIVVYKLHWIISVAFFLPFGALEMSLLVANIRKVPHGACFTLMITFTMLAFILLWHWGISTKTKQKRRDKVRLKDVLFMLNEVGQPFILGNEMSQEHG